MFAITGMSEGSMELALAVWLDGNPAVRISLLLVIPAVLYIAWRRA